MLATAVTPLLPVRFTGSSCTTEGLNPPQSESEQGQPCALALEECAGAGVPVVSLDADTAWLDPQRFLAQHNLELASLWQGLCSRRLRNLASFYTEDECCTVLESASSGDDFGKPIDEGHVRILEKLLLSTNQKTVALELGRSVSTVSSTLRRTLLQLGFDCTGSKLPMFLVMALHAARGPVASPTRARSTWVEIRGRRCQLVFVRRPDLNLRHLLSEAELAVTRLAAQGLSHANIARARGTSRRTIANQLAMSFRKLQVSGRIQMLALLVGNRVSSIN